MKKVLVIGNRGYIGSAVAEYLSRFFEIDGVDIIDGKDYGDLDVDYVQSFDSVLLFAALSTVEQCNRNIFDVFDQNVHRFVGLLRKMHRDQKLIYASSSSVYGTKKRNSMPSEDHAYCNPIFAYDASKLMIDSIAPFADIEYYGLRLGTVCGASPKMRETMMNSMTKSAIETGKIVAVNPSINRPILAMSDLVRCLHVMIAGHDRRGIYNLASWNTTVGEAAEDIRAYFESCNEIIDVENRVGPIGYDISIECSKFAETFDFRFSEDRQSLVKEIAECYRTKLKIDADVAEAPIS
jgi:nucleoside-diphosphate-sugar epimerase